MRKFLIISLIFIYKNTFCQLNDNFDDGDFTSNPVWTASNDNWDFTVNDDKQLQSNLISTAVSSNFYISTANTKALNCIWEFDCNLKFATSNANYADVYLISNTDNLQSNSINGYFVRIGNTTDEISLYRRNGTLNSSVKIIDGADNVVNSTSNNPFRIRVTRTADGEFTLEWDRTQTGSNYQTEGAVTDNTFTTTSWFGVYIQQSTATFHRKHFFDNFIIKDITPPELISLSVENNQIALAFDKHVDAAKANNINNYQLNPGNIFPVSAITDNNIVTLSFNNDFETGNYTLTIQNIEDLKGNAIETPIVRNFSYLKPYFAKPKDILINEILFNPRPGGQDFVEIYNNTQKTLDFKDLFLASANDKDSVINIRTITNTSVLFEPGTYWVLTTNPDNIKTEYHTTAPDNFIKMSSMPAYNDDKGVVVLLNHNHERIDQLNYDKKMHFALLKDVEGVSLERSFFNEDTNKPGNFRSATATVGYATPAYKNSQYMDEFSGNTEGISLSSKVFSPDNDGFDDILSINYNINSTNTVANVKIYNDNGRLVKKLINNEPVSSTGNWIWDGLDSSNNRVNAGIYIVYTEFFNLEGNVKKYKNAVSVAYRK